MLSILTVYSFIDLDIVACYKALLARYHVNVRFLRLSGIFYITHLFLQEFVNHVVVRNDKCSDTFSKLLLIPLEFFPYSDYASDKKRAEKRLLAQRGLSQFKDTFAVISRVFFSS